MPDMTVTWKGAVPYDGYVGQAEHVGAASADTMDARMISAGIVAKPFYSSSFESAMSGAVPYVSAPDDESD